MTDCHGLGSPSNNNPSPHNYGGWPLDRGGGGRGLASPEASLLGSQIDGCLPRVFLLSRLGLCRLCSNPLFLKGHLASWIKGHLNDVILTYLIEVLSQIESPSEALWVRVSSSEAE